MRAKKAKKTDVKYEIHYGLKKSLEFMESPLSIANYTKLGVKKLKPKSIA